jgi:hypothetical protein
MADKHGLLNSWLEVFSPTVMGCLAPDHKAFDMGKWREWLRSSGNAGANGGRILAYAPWAYPSGAVPIDKLWSPYRLDPVQRAWNLDLWNDAYFVTLRQMVAVAAEYNIRIWFSLFDNCQFHHGVTFSAPWGNNVQGFRDYYASLPYALKWVDKILSVLGDDVNYELINEGEPRGDMAKAVKWNVAVFDRLIAGGIKPENICWGALPSSIYKDGKFNQDREHDLAQQILSVTERRDREQSNKVYRAMHGVGKADEIVNGKTFPASYCGEWALQWWGKAHSGKGFLSDDGVRNGSNILDRLPGGAYAYQRPGAAEWYAVTMLILRADGGKVGKWIIERLPQNLDPAVQLPALAEGISKAYHDVYGVWPENYGKFPPVIINDDVPEPEPAPEPATPRPRFGWLGEWRNNWKWIVGIVILIVLAIAIF